jgi:L-alanine-DL-glutamate epimerase-like enolase superfamily enzyme
MRITTVSVTPLWMPMEHPYVIATSSMAANPVDIVRVVTDEGVIGYGEAMPAYEFTGETLWTVEDVIHEHLAPLVLGRDPFDLEPITAAFEQLVGNQAAKAGLELALWDLRGKALGRPVTDLLGGRTRSAVPLMHAFGWDEPEALAAKARARAAEGVTIFKVKVGDAPGRDAARVAAVREAVGSRAQIKCDANTGWVTARRAVEAIRLLEPFDVEFVEEPVRRDDLAACRFVRERVDVPIALDESVRGPREALAAVRAGACDIINVKLMKCGGILNALKVNAIAEAGGVALHVGSMGEVAGACAAMIALHGSLANALYSDTADAAAQGYLETLATGLVQRLDDGVLTMRVPDGPGLGLEYDEAAIARLRATRPWLSGERTDA